MARVDLRRTVLVGGAIVLAALLAAGLLTALVLDRGDAGGAAPELPESGIAGTAVLEPRIVLFGDTVVARVELVVDREAVDPTGVRVAWAPAPWRPVRPPERTVEISGHTAHVVLTYVLRCLTRECAPARPTEEVTLAPARVTYGGSSTAGAGPASIPVTWPTLVVHSRLSALDTGRADALSAPWRADFVSLPAVSYRLDPALALGLLIALAALLFAVAAVVAYRAWPRREPEPEPESEPEPVASPLEQALALLESPVPANGTESRRRALELVADEIERLGDLDLALDVRALAWSAESPEAPVTRALASRLRDRMSLNGVPA